MYLHLADGKNLLEPIYPTTEKLKAKALNGKQLAKLTETLISLLSEKDIQENLPDGILKRWQFTYLALKHILIFIFLKVYSTINRRLDRLKFEEFFIAQVRLGLTRLQRHRYSKGALFEKVGEYFNTFYNHHLPFELTGAQKRVLKEIRLDTGRGKQMNRLLQGDVGSGKTIVALLIMLLAADNGYQSCLMAPTEILATQHFLGLAASFKRHAYKNKSAYRKY